MASNQRGFQFYTGNFIDIKNLATNDQKYSIHEGFAIEAHNYPDAVNIVMLCFSELVNV